MVKRESSPYYASELIRVMTAMRTLPALMALVLFSSIPVFSTQVVSAETQEAALTTTLLANAEQASITNPYTATIDDHFGDPANFVKYIIRRPPALA